MKTRHLVEAAVVAALYVVLTWAVAPVGIAYGLIQLRISEVLKGLMPFRKHLIGAFVVGNFLANLLSPQGGIWEWLWMPAVNLVGATGCWYLGRRQPYAGAVLYALAVAAGVATELRVLAHVPWLTGFVSVGASELLLIVGGVPLMGLVDRRLRSARGAS